MERRAHLGEGEGTLGRVAPPAGRFPRKGGIGGYRADSGEPGGRGGQGVDQPTDDRDDYARCDELGHDLSAFGGRRPPAAC